MILKKKRSIDMDLLRQTCEYTKDNLGNMIVFLNLRDTVQMNIDNLEERTWKLKTYDDITDHLALRFFYDYLFFAEKTFDENRFKQEYKDGKYAS